MDEIPDVSDSDADVLAAKATGLSLGDPGTATAGSSGPTPAESIPDMDDIPDMEDDTVQQVDDPAAESAPTATNPPVPPAGSSNLVQIRTYDCLITYDKYYQTPRMWLLGYDEHKNPLPPNLVFQDISSDYAQKTVTVESFPHLSGVSCATVHPCKHASVMKKVIDRTNASLLAAKQAGQQPPGAQSTKKRGWISAAKKAALGGGTTSSRKESKEQQELTAEDQQEGLRVDQCMSFLARDSIPF